MISNAIVMKTAVIALAVFRHLVLFGECLNTNPLLVALMVKLRLDVVWRKLF